MDNGIMHIFTCIYVYYANMYIIINIFFLYIFRHLMFMFIDDIIIFPKDQYSYRYPSLYTFNILHYPA